MSQNKEKLESELFQQYQQAIDLLENGNEAQGIQILKELMQNQSIINQDDKKILYGIYMSLAEILVQSDCVQNKCEALYYYYQSTLISDNCWQTQRKMALIFRQLGMMPRALNVILKALQLCNQPNIIEAILYQVCSICFLMNDQKQFEIYFDKMSDNNNLKHKIAELKKYFIDKNNVTDFVKELIQEQSEIQQQLEKIPCESAQKLLYFNQTFSFEIKLDTYDLKKFFKKIQNILQINVNFESKKFDFIHNDKCFMSNTKIIVISKEQQQNSKDVSKELPKENQPVKQSERQKSKKTKQQQDQQFVLDQIIQSNHNKLIELLKQFDGNEIFQLNNNNNKIQSEQNENQECPVAKFLLENLNNKQFLTIIQLLEKLISLICLDFQQYDDAPLQQQSDTLNEQLKSPQKALKGLINCIVWAQHSTNKFTDDPKIKLRLLEVAYEELTFRFKEKKPKSPEQQNKIKNFITFINNMKLELLQTNINQIITDKAEIQKYLSSYYRVMAYIHSDINFFQGRIAKQCSQQLNNPELSQEILDKIKSAQFQISSSSPHQSQQIQQILTQWEQKEQRLEDNEKIRTQIIYVQDYLKQNQSYDMIKRLAIICLNQFYFVQQKEELKIIYKFVQPLIQQFLNIPQPDLSIGFIFLKFSIIYSLMELDSSEFLAKFIEIFLQQTNGQNKHLLLIEILKFHHLNINKLFNYINIDLILQEFIKTKIKMKNRYDQLIEHYKNNVSNDLELRYYLLHLLDLKDQYTPQFIVQQNELQIEIEKQETKYPQPESFSSASEEEIESDEVFLKSYQNIHLLQDQIDSSFKLGKYNYQFTTKTVEFLLNHTIKVNIGDPKIIEHIKRLAKEIIRVEYGLTTKEFSYYLQQEFERDLSEAELQFMGYFLTHFSKIFSDQRQLNQFTIDIIKRSLQKYTDPKIQEFAEWLYSQIFTKQKSQITSIKEFQDCVTQNNLQCEYKSNLYYQIQKSEEINFNENQPKFDLKNICYALAYKESPYLWNYLYQGTFEQAQKQFKLKTQTEIDWFLSQKKIQAYVNKNPLLNHLNEYRYVMDLIKLKQRQVEYQHSNNEQLYKKTEQGYQSLYQKQYNIPKDAFEIENNFRVLQLYEKKVMRKYRNVPIERISQNLDNINSLVNLIKQMKEYEIEYLSQSSDGELEMKQDLYINIYKFIRRFLRHRLYYQLKQLIQIVKEKFSDLLNQSQSDLKFEFQYDNRKFKISNFNQEQLEKEENTEFNNDEINVILNNLLNIFIENTQKLVRKKAQRYIIEAFYYATHLKFNSQAPIDQVFAQISSIYQPNSRDLVYYYLQIDKYKCEKDEVLSHYYSQDLIFNYQKSKILKLIIKILLKMQKYKDIYQLFEKLHKTYDIRLYQACIGLLEEYRKIDDKVLIRDIILKSESYRRTTELFKQDSIVPLLNNMYIRFYEKDQQEQNEGNFLNETSEIKLEKGKKLIEDYRATKRKPAKPKDQQQQSQQQQQQQQTQNAQAQIQTQLIQQVVDDVGQYINQGTIIQSFNDFDNI
ncbi:unnamed protein product (macronuclear) [Paramecium tetraurelia]|uniref:Armadillo-type fold n=1 Tax=Paramecium tetraurelia TaxID=5888 RepID=A0CMY6_PARTE|nr:uncharacterized protein GSPATT00008594001 [Paramecium tetraurelia]CAK72153.1 unnamed protein product [Paramecium tetraurelia]|eukprot:XP_001439550.1 hypothetical protein (macronuclear) [Paramecium tetraurelia strain d4-2]